MGERQWLRTYELTVGKGGSDGIKTSELKVAFRIKKGDTESPNEARISVWNL